MAWTAEIKDVAPSETSETIVVTVEFSDGDQVTFQKDYSFGRYYVPTNEQLADRFTQELQAFKNLRDWEAGLRDKIGFVVELDSPLTQEQKSSLSSPGQISGQNTGLPTP